MTPPPDPLYRSLTELPDDVERHRFAGIEVGVRVTDTGPRELAAMWSADREVSLVLTDDVDADALRRLLPGFVAHARTLADRPTHALVSLPARDVARCRVAHAAGFFPATTLAACDLSRPVAGPFVAGGLTVRDATEADVDVLTELWCHEAEYETEVGTLRLTDAIRSAVSAEAPRRIAGTSTVLLGERDGRIVCAVVAESVDDSAWSAERVRPAPVSYLSMASTAPGARGGGAASAVVAELHRRHRAAGVVVSVLHYGTVNPLSVPFWSRQGYRPLLSHLSLTLTAGG